MGGMGTSGHRGRGGANGVPGRTGHVAQPLPSHVSPPGGYFWKISGTGL